jgi:hypothetical protein
VLDADDGSRQVEIDDDEVDIGVVRLGRGMHHVSDGALEKAGGGAQRQHLVVSWHETAAEDAKIVDGDGALAHLGGASRLLVGAAHCWRLLLCAFEHARCTGRVRF